MKAQPINCRNCEQCLESKCDRYRFEQLRDSFNEFLNAIRESPFFKWLYKIINKA